MTCRRDKRRRGGEEVGLEEGYLVGGEDMAERRNGNGRGKQDDWKGMTEKRY